MNGKIREKLENLPESPGSYQMFDKEGRIIYVGKAKNLKNRVRSYFIGAHNDKTTALISKIDDLNYIETKNEKEAFLLEISLIKEHVPYYNINLTDDKTYPYIEFTKEKNPKLVITRKISKKNNRFFGPYPNVVEAKTTLELINKLYKMRKCKSLPSKACIYYDIKECFAPCIHKTSQLEYDKMYKEIKGFLNGKDHSLINKLKQEMLEYSEKLDFENAKKTRDILNAVQSTIVKQDVILKAKIDIDIFGITYDENYLSITILYIRNGIITLSKSDVLPYYFDVYNAILEYAEHHYQSSIIPKEIYIDKEFTEVFSLLDVFNRVLSPQKGTKKKLLVMAQENSVTKLQNQNKISIDKRRRSIESIGEILNIPTPYRIESFDNSNLFGDSPVSSMVVYLGGKKAPNEYRKFLVKTVNGPNDFETMKEVIKRRYTRVKDENLKRPDLILADGGEIQVKAIEESLNELELDIKVAGLKKDDNHKTNTIIYKGKEIKIDKHSDAYSLLFEIQEEVHRFAITFHRSLKEKNAFTSLLDGIKGLGPVGRRKLLESYKTLDGIKEATDDELKKIGLAQKVIVLLREELEKDADAE